MAELKLKRQRGRPPGAKNKPKPNGAALLKAKAEFFAVNPKALREIKRLAEETRISREQIFEDVLDNGLIAVRAMYVGLIEQRKTIREQLETVLNPRSIANPVDEPEPARKGTGSSTRIDEPGEDQPDAPDESGGLQEAPEPDPEEVLAQTVGEPPSTEENPYESDN